MTIYTDVEIASNYERIVKGARVLKKLGVETQFGASLLYGNENWLDVLVTTLTMLNPDKGML